MGVRSSLQRINNPVRLQITESPDGNTLEIGRYGLHSVRYRSES